MEQKISQVAPKEHKLPISQRMLGLAALSLPLIACKASDILVSGDPAFAFIRGAAGTVLLEAELGVGKLVNHALTKTQHYALGCLTLVACAAPPIAVGVLSIEHPWIGTVALAAPLVSAFIYLTKRD